VNLQIQNIPRQIDEALRARAQAQGKTVDQVALEALETGLGLTARGGKQRDLSDIAGTWVEDPIFDEVRRSHETIDPDP
jgi:plasmid stability protein